MTILKTDLSVLRTAAQGVYSYACNDYHNWEHACRVAETTKLLMLTELAEHNDAVYIAAIWHDAIYFAGANEGVNENASAAALKSAWHGYQISEDYSILTEAMYLIEHTSISNHLVPEAYKANKLLPILLDADLSALADSYELFVQNQTAIIIENFGDAGTKEAHQKCGAFLSKFLTVRPFIYHTTTARNLYETKAKANITKYLQDYA